ncbi:TPA: hypothetical protein N0F65_007970 [Lagenidium giganteum]|uniref:Uncharacterized protein n=1 Tax=Lagenidium giganteum TaxID=4803 RepID=A0AAV2YJB4_9STRA|nr:TPA: hypothetical protein N0F65_007970 [Lagenidium giganteum]
MIQALKDADARASAALIDLTGANDGDVPKATPTKPSLNALGDLLRLQNQPLLSRESVDTKARQHTPQAPQAAKAAASKPAARKVTAKKVTAKKVTAKKSTTTTTTTSTTPSRKSTRAATPSPAFPASGTQDAVVTSTPRSTRPRRGCRFRLINVLLSPDYSVRWAEMQLTLPGDARSSRFWQDVQKAYVTSNEVFGSLQFDDALFASISPESVVHHSAATLHQMWCEILNLYTQAVRNSRQSQLNGRVSHSFFDFCSGRLDLLYLHMGLLLEPQLAVLVLPLEDTALARSASLGKASPAKPTQPKPTPKPTAKPTAKPAVKPKPAPKSVPKPTQNPTPTPSKAATVISKPRDTAPSKPTAVAPPKPSVAAPPKPPTSTAKPTVTKTSNTVSKQTKSTTNQAPVTAQVPVPQSKQTTASKTATPVPKPATGAQSLWGNPIKQTNHVTMPQAVTKHKPVSVQTARAPATTNVAVSKGSDKGPAATGSQQVPTYQPKSVPQLDTGREVALDTGRSVPAPVYRDEPAPIAVAVAVQRSPKPKTPKKTAGRTPPQSKSVALNQRQVAEEDVAPSNLQANTPSTSCARSAVPTIVMPELQIDGSELPDPSSLSITPSPRKRAVNREPRASTEPECIEEDEGVEEVRIARGEKRPHETTDIVAVPQNELYAHPSKRMHSSLTTMSSVGPIDEWDIVEHRLRRVNDCLDRCYRGLADENIQGMHRHGLEDDLRFYTAMKKTLQEQLLMSMHGF